MYKIGIVDDDELFGLAIRRFLSRDFEVSVFTRVSSFLQQQYFYDLVIVDYSIPCANYEKEIDGCQLICQVKGTLPNPPILVLLTGFLSKNNLELGKGICPEADSFLAKDAGLDTISQQVKYLLASKRQESLAV